MKFFLTFLFGILFITSITFGAEQAPKKVEEQAYLGEAMENGIRVREDKNINSKQVGSYYKGEKIKIYERSAAKEKVQDMEDYWYRVDFQGQKAWMFGHFLIAEEPIENLEGTVTTNNVRIRKEYGLGAEVIEKVSKDDKFKIVGKTNKQLQVDDKKDFWYKIVLKDNTYAWIFGEFITITSTAPTPVKK